MTPTTWVLLLLVSAVCGQDYVAVLSPNIDDSYSQVLAGRQNYQSDVYFTVKIPYLNFTEKVKPWLRCNISKKAELKPMVKERKGIFVSYYSLMYIMNMAHQSSDGYVLVNFVDFRNGRFVAVTTEPRDKNGKDNATISVIMVNGYQTNVTFYLKMSGGVISFNGINYRNGDIFNISLQQNETFQLSHNYDLTGTVISASTNLAVTSGNICNKVGYGPCSHLVEMIPPIGFLCSTYIVSALKNIDHTRVRIVAAQTSTFVLLEENGKQETHDLQTGEFIEKRLKETQVMTIVSSNPVMVSQIAEGSIFKRKGGPFMITVQGICQFQKEYSFAVPDGNFESIVTVTIELSGVTTSLKYDGKTLIPPSDTKVVSVSGTLYTIFSFPVPPGNHTIIHYDVTRGTPFSLAIHGIRDRDGYGYPGALNYQN